MGFVRNTAVEDYFWYWIFLGFVIFNFLFLPFFNFYIIINYYYFWYYMDIFIFHYITLSTRHHWRHFTFHISILVKITVNLMRLTAPLFLLYFLNVIVNFKQKRLNYRKLYSNLGQLHIILLTFENSKLNTYDVSRFPSSLDSLTIKIVI